MILLRSLMQRMKCQQFHKQWMSSLTPIYFLSTKIIEPQGNDQPVIRKIMIVINHFLVFLFNNASEHILIN